MTYIFDGRGFARQKEETLQQRVRGLLEYGIKPKLVSIIVGDDPASVLYVNLKKKAAERIGCVLSVRREKSDIGKEKLIEMISLLNEDKTIFGIMVQLPLPENFTKEDREEIISSIDPDKDVDGLRVGSKFIPPTAKAVLNIIKEAEKYIVLPPLKARLYKVGVVGGSGFIGKQIAGALNGINNYNIAVYDSETIDLRQKTGDLDILISVTGVPDLIKPDMVKDGAVLIDVGSPKGDIEKSAYDKAAFVSPVPGGVGPVTISCLLENLLDSLSDRIPKSA